MDNELQAEILGQLGLGKKSAIPGKILAQRLGMKGTRAIRKEIADMVADRVPIIGCSKGYFIAETAGECEEYTEFLLAYIKDLAIHKKNFKLASRRLREPEQVRMRL